jgi:hypothetical protein
MTLEIQWIQTINTGTFLDRQQVYISIHLPRENETLLHTLLKEGFILYDLSKEIHSSFLSLFKLFKAIAVRNIQHLTVSGLHILKRQNNTTKGISNKRSYMI